MSKPFMSTPSTIIVRHYSLFKKWGSDCCKKTEQEACPAENQQKYVVAKSCCKSIFETWKPVVPDLSAPPLPTIKQSLMAPYKHKSCKAGMKFREPSRCVSDALARECLKKTHPKWLMKCPKTTVDQLGALSLMKEAVLRSKETKGQLKKKKPEKINTMCDMEVPMGDWNPDGKF